MGADIVRHKGGFIEIGTPEGPLLLTEEEFERAFRRGASVALNRQAAGERVHVKRKGVIA